jgi:enterochelin esterase-like enzyme
MAVTIGFLFGMFANAQDRAARKGVVERVQLHGRSLEGNLEGDSPKRDVAVYLPPSYRSNGTQRYPVVYLLHGFTDKVDNWWGVNKHFVNVPAVIDRAVAAGVREMIVVMPDAFTRYQGSMYSNSATTGNWEEFVSKELVGFIDSKYRTIASPEGRGLAGHSMGGYGALRIGMKYPEVYSSLYLMSPCCLAPSGGSPNPRAEAIKDPAEVANADFGTKAVFASAAAWSPNPNNPPLFVDLPFHGGNIRPEIVSKWHANAPLAMIDQYVFNLRKYKALAVDVGKNDRSIAATVVTLHNVLDRYKIEHAYEVYDGDHTNKVARQLEMKVLPFFAQHLAGRTRK